MSRLSPEVRGQILMSLPQARAIAERTLGLFKSAIDKFQEEIDYFGSGADHVCGAGRC